MRAAAIVQSLGSATASLKLSEPEAKAGICPDASRCAISPETNGCRSARGGADATTCAELLPAPELFARPPRHGSLIALTGRLRAIADRRVRSGFLLMGAVQPLCKQQSRRRAATGEGRGQPAPLLAEALIVEVDQLRPFCFLGRARLAARWRRQPQLLARRFVRVQPKHRRRSHAPGDRFASTRWPSPG